MESTAWTITALIYLMTFAAFFLMAIGLTGIALWFYRMFLSGPPNRRR